MVFALPGYCPGLENVMRDLAGVRGW